MSHLILSAPSLTLIATTLEECSVLTPIGLELTTYSTNVSWAISIAALVVAKLDLKVLMSDFADIVQFTLFTKEPEEVLENSVVNFFCNFVAISKHIAQIVSRAHSKARLQALRIILKKPREIWSDASSEEIMVMCLCTSRISRANTVR